MYTVKSSAKFKKDYKLCLKRKLPDKYKPHTLKGDYKGCWECHIQPDWLLIWEQDKEIRLISLIRTGSHSDLF